MPRSRNTRIRPKDTSRVEARRRYRDDQRQTEDGPDEVDAAEALAEEAAPKSRSMFQIPNFVDDLKALPGVFRSKWVWVPFALLGLTFVLSVALVNGALDDLPPPVRDGLTLYISLTLHPTSLFIFFIGGFVAPRSSYLIGGILGLLSGLIYVAVVSIATNLARAGDDALVATTNGVVPDVTPELILQTLGMGLFIGVFAGGFAAWYRRFLRSSQERAAANRAAKEREQAQKAKEQARADRAQQRSDKYAARQKSSK